MASRTPSLSLDQRVRRNPVACAIAVIATAGSIVLALGLPGPVPARAALSLPVDARDAHGPLDLSSVSLVQRDVGMALRISTSGSWSAKDVVGTRGRELCVTLIHGMPAVSPWRVCVTRRDGKPALSYTPLSGDGGALRRRPLAATVRRPRQSVLEATFLPSAAGLPLGRHAWFASSAWSDERGCSRGCEDRLPDGGVVAGHVALLSVVPCFGAAARDPQRPCSNPELRLSVEPSLRRAHDVGGSYCDRRERTGLMSICTFGTAADEAAGTFALLGDSHAGGLKSALEVVTVGKRWRGASILRAGCPATRAAQPALPTAQRVRQCVEWNRQLLEWLARHREVGTAFLSAHATATVVAVPARPPADSVVAGYRDEIRALLRLVPRVVVIRDIPDSRRRQPGCIAGALNAGQEPGPACALPRPDVVPADPLVAAATSLRSARVQVIDLTPHFCDELRCYPVIGGALVQRDETHLTATFSATLGPYILRALG